MRRRLVAPLTAYVLAEAVVIGVVFALGGFPLWVSSVVGILVSVGGMLIVIGLSDDVQLRNVSVTPLDASSHPRVASVLDALTTTNGVAISETYLIESDNPNATAFGLRTPTVAVSRGLLDRLDRVELEGVIAHLVSVMRERDVATETLVSSIARFVPGHRLTSWLIRRVTPDAPVVRADLGGARLTRYPPALIAALDKIRGTDTSIDGVAEESAHLWVFPPVTGRHEPHPTLEERMDALREL